MLTGKKILATPHHSRSSLLGNLSTRHPSLRPLLFPWDMGAPFLFHSLAIFRLIDYFDRLRNLIFLLNLCLLTTTNAKPADTPGKCFSR